MEAKYIRRRIVVFLLAMAMLIGVWLLIKPDPAYTCQKRQTTAKWGDTVTSLVEDNCEGDLQQAIFDISMINSGGNIKAGEVVIFP